MRDGGAGARDDRPSDADRRGKVAAGGPREEAGTSHGAGEGGAGTPGGPVSAEEERRRWDERYRSDETGIPEQASPVVRQVAPLLRPPGLALDLACGPGRNALFLAERGFRVLAVDLSGVALDRLSRRVGRRGLPVWPVQADLGRFDAPPHSFDLVVNTHFLHRALFPVIRRSLKRGGHVVFATFTVDEIERFGRDLPRDLLLEPGELRREFDGFEIVRYEEDVFRRCRRRRRAMARLVARKPGG